MDDRGGGLFRYRHNYTTSSQRISVYSCTSHANCPCLAKISHANGQYILQSTSVHSTEVATETRTGIDDVLQPEVDNLLEGGAGPEGCLVILRNRYADRPEMLDRLPSRGMLKSRKQFLTRQDRGTVFVLSQFV
ncbi:hypothetical protein AM587_10013287 [Phytophthora nicotianae]|uniref:Uncharacterized protein n=1 Tax=Phytophthora nicotianae TaxID=4792 RepID=A0A0W8CS05_PHYNI|nr:hypothetical protein AM588_10003000 [Phytophthora nicotianae]KUF94804.1 hypothetical protein AM587_10013287 [Phytophthora nicotianae]